MPSRSWRGRRSIRLRGYDYTLTGAYFITIATQDRRRLFGDIVHARMQLNDAGRMVLHVWHAIPEHYPGVGIDAFVVMPDHVHGVVTLRRSPAHAADVNGIVPTSRQPLSLSDVVHRFKALTTTRYIQGVRESQWEAFRVRLWERNYYDRIVRDEAALRQIRAYITENPARWG